MRRKGKLNTRIISETGDAIYQKLLKKMVCVCRNYTACQIWRVFETVPMQVPSVVDISHHVRQLA